MKAMICEMCNSNNIQKQDGLYICKSCGTKYSVEEARELLIEGTVKVDTSNELKKLYKAAETARNANNHKSAIKYYEKIAEMDPDAWEPVFYIPILRIHSIKNYEILSSTLEIIESLYTVFTLISDSVKDTNEQAIIAAEIASACIDAASMLAVASQSFFDSLTSDKNIFGKVLAPEFNENKERYNKIEAMLHSCGWYIESNFDLNNESIKKTIALCWASMLELEKGFRKNNGNNAAISHEYFNEVLEKIKIYDPMFNEIEPIAINAKGNGGCYVATAVYGSYDCPEVWTLRRFRDNTLAKTWYGRAFVRTYYAISPTLVKQFGNAEWFKNMWKPTLDKMVKDLTANGVESTPYNDRQW